LAEPFFQFDGSGRAFAKAIENLFGSRGHAGMILVE
jgi:hypothetical protein